MSTTTGTIERDVDTVWSVLSDGWLYPLFVVGASRMRDVDEDWPAVGSCLHHSVGTWPLLIDDTTEVLECEPRSLLRLRARAWPSGAAEVTFRLQPRGATTEVTIEEDAVNGPATLIPPPVRHPMLDWRNRETLRRLALLAERRGTPCRRGDLVVTGYDAVVIGAGPNGLVAGNVLADAGWSVLVVEEQPEVGGAVRSDREVHPDFVHDTFSAFYPLGVGSPTIRDMGLEDYGLRWRHAPAVLGHPMPDGRWALLHRDREDTARSLDALHPGDGEVWLSLCETWERIGDQLVGALFAPFPPVRGGARLLPAIVRAGGLELLRTMALPATDLARRFGGPGGGLLLAGNAGHADIPLTAPGSGLFGILLSMLGQSLGYPAPEGGAGRLSAAMADRLRARGGEILCDAAVASVLIEDGRAAGVVTVDGERHLASRAVVADVSAPVLFRRLVPSEALPRRLAAELDDFQLDPSTVKVDWALDGPVPWASPAPAAPGTVHVADDVTQMSATTAEVGAGAIPASPFLLMGQMTTTDPTRSPAGTESLWAYTHVPQPEATVSDLGDGSIQGVWDHDDCERFADRMQARVERLAPGFGDRVVARRVLGPHQLEARNRSLVGGAVNGGTSQLHQQLVFRPVPAMRGRPETGIPGLYLGSASAHPGGGVHGAPGHNAARAALRHDRWRRTAGLLQMRALRGS